MDSDQLGKDLGTPIVTRHGCFTHWWATLPAVPPARDALDHWVAHPDGRASRYDRLKRVWFDPTRFLAPKDDPCRPHEFSKPAHGTHLTCKTWETFGLFHPLDWIPRLLRLAGHGDPITPLDCAWSYEFEAMVGDSRRFKLADVVLHVRDARGEEIVVVVEVKRPGDRLKEGSDLPDTEPSSYLDREAFNGFPKRFLIYLVDAPYAATVRDRVNQRDARWGLLTWSQLAELQLTLATDCFPDPLATFFRFVIASQFLGYDISGLPQSLPFSNSRGTLTQQIGQNLPLWQDRLTGRDDMPEYIQQAVRASFQYLTCFVGERPSALAFSYLEHELSFEQIHLLPQYERQTTTDRRKSLWRLPPMAAAQAPRETHRGC